MPHTKSNENNNKLFKKFERFSQKISDVVGSPYWFVFSISLVIIWIMSGPLMEWSENWQLVINTTTTILTFLMMALLHSSQSKWEDRMEKLQQKEGTKIKAIEKTTKKLAYEKGEKPIAAKDIEKEEMVKELVESLH